MTKSPTFTLPDMPVCEAIRQCRPTMTLCAICTRLSILVPSPMMVSRVEPRSIVRICTDFDVVLDDDAARLRDFLMALRTGQIAKAVLTDARARIDDDAIANQGMQDCSAGANRTVAPDADIRPDHRACSNHSAGADLGVRPDDSERIEGYAGFETRRGMDMSVDAAPALPEQ